eukprot:Tamp_19149.p1 GENE.Tamp_19149~~Tamp_19149.p1  ORF type:complete len:313 (-),score=21.41 Tamp_19149:340-1209(-)
MECSVCGRRFALDRIAVHTGICKRLAQKNRGRRHGVFDSRAQRLTGELASLAPPRTMLGRGAGRGAVSRKLGRETQARIAPTHVAKTYIHEHTRTYTNWREKRAELRQGLRAARQYRAERAYSHHAPNHDPSSRMPLGGARAAADVRGFGAGVAYGSSPRDAVYKTKPLSAGRVGLASGLGGRTSTFGGRGKDQLVKSSQLLRHHTIATKSNASPSHRAEAAGRASGSESHRLMDRQPDMRPHGASEFLRGPQSARHHSMRLPMSRGGGPIHSNQTSADNPLAVGWQQR